MDVGQMMRKLFLSGVVFTKVGKVILILLGLLLILGWTWLR